MEKPQTRRVPLFEAPGEKKKPSHESSPSTQTSCYQLNTPHLPDVLYGGSAITDDWAAIFGLSTLQFGWLAFSWRHVSVFRRQRFPAWTVLRHTLADAGVVSEAVAVAVFDAVAGVVVVVVIVDAAVAVVNDAYAERAA